MTIGELIVFVVAIVLGVVGTVWATRRFNLRRPNFRNEKIPAVAGLVLVTAGVFFYGVEWLCQGVAAATPAVYFLATFAFGVLGMADDILGDRSVGGFRGHIRAAIRGEFTTGFAKLLGGGIVSLVAGFLLYYPAIWQALLAAIVIALTANMLNLLDVRPGRCLFGFLLGTVCLVGYLGAVHRFDGGFFLYFAVAMALVLYPLDAMGQLMLGDTGSNAFGAILGVTVAIIAPTVVQIGVVAAMVMFQVWCEKNSFNALIERNAVLRGIDRKIGVR